MTLSFKVYFICNKATFQRFDLTSNIVREDIKTLDITLTQFFIRVCYFVYDKQQKNTQPYNKIRPYPLVMYKNFHYCFNFVFCTRTHFSTNTFDGV